MLMSKKFLIYFFLINFSLIVFCLFINDRFILNRQPIVEFDLKGTTQVFLDSLSKKNLSPEATQKIANTFVQILQKAISNYTNSHDAIVLVSPAVIAGAPDITNEIKAKIVDELNQQNISKSEANHV